MLFLSMSNHILLVKYSVHPEEVIEASVTNLIFTKLLPILRARVPCPQSIANSSSVSPLIIFKIILMFAVRLWFTSFSKSFW